MELEGEVYKYHICVGNVSALFTVNNNHSKIFAICDYYLQGKVQKHSRHIYDIYKLLPLVPQDEAFKNLVHEVRSIRAQSSICPSSLPDVNIPQLLEKIIVEKVNLQFCN